MRLEDIAASISVDPERERKYAKQLCRSLRGRVRMNTAFRFALVCFVVLLAVRMLWLCTINPGVGAMLMTILVILGGILVLWYVLSWELTFDGETGFFSYHTLLKGTIRFHVSDIRDLQTRSGERTHKGTVMLMEMLRISVEGETIHIITRAQHMGSAAPFMPSFGAYKDSDKLQQYLDLYQKCIASPTAGLAVTGVDPRIAAAIAREKKNAEPEAAAVPEREAVPKRTVDLEKKTAPKKTVDLQKETNPPSPKKEPSDAPSPTEKKPVDVDALFDSVLSQYGKKR